MENCNYFIAFFDKGDRERKSFFDMIYCEQPPNKDIIEYYKNEIAKKYYLKVKMIDCIVFNKTNILKLLKEIN
jgi:hypothetical protein